MHKLGEWVAHSYMTDLILDAKVERRVKGKRSLTWINKVHVEIANYTGIRSDSELAERGIYVSRYYKTKATNDEMKPPNGD